MSSYVYTLEADGLRTGVTETESTGTVSKVWSYDALQRLTQEAVTVTGTPGYSSYTDTYSFDIVGNRLGKAHTAGSQTQTIASTYNANDQLTTEASTGSVVYTSTYGYDANGSQTSKTTTGTTDAGTFGYDLQNRLTSADLTRLENGQSVHVVASYSYDDNGARASSTVSVNGGANITTGYLVDGNNPTGYTQVLEEHTNGAAAPSLSYLIGLSVLGQTTPAGATSYLQPDAQGSTRFLTDASGTVTAHIGYDAYGTALNIGTGITGPPATRILYVGQQLDLALQQYYLRARYYAAATGRFPARDPLGEASNDANAYRYGHANPIRFVDPSGMQDVVEEEEAIATGEALEVGLWEPVVVLKEQVIHTFAAIKVISTLLLSGIAVGGFSILVQAVVDYLEHPWPVDRSPEVSTDQTTEDCNCTPNYTYLDLDSRQRATGALARFSKDQIRPPGTREGFVGEPRWYNTTNLPIEPGERLGDIWEKGHLIGSRLGGAGRQQWRNMVPLYARANAPTMYWEVEAPVADMALAGACVDYLAVPMYDTDHYYPDNVLVVALVNRSVQKVVNIPNRREGGL